MTAMLLHTSLQAAGYTGFFDNDSLDEDSYGVLFEYCSNSCHLVMRLMTVLVDDVLMCSLTLAVFLVNQII